MLRSALPLFLLIAGAPSTAAQADAETTADAPPAHVVPFGQAGNAVELVLAAGDALPLEADVHLAEAPEWATVRPEQLRVSAGPGGEAVATFAFDVLPTAPAGEPGALVFTVETADGRRAEHRVEVEVAAPARFSLGRPRPNPARGRVTLPVALPKAGRLVVEAYDVLGRRVTVLHDGAAEAGGASVALDAGRLASGPYVVRAAVAPEGGRAQSDVQRLTVVR